MSHPDHKIRAFAFTPRQKLIAQLNGLRSEFNILLESVRVNAILMKREQIPEDHFGRLCHVLSNALIIELVKFIEVYKKGGLGREIETWPKGRQKAVQIYLSQITKHNWEVLRHNNLAHPHSNSKGEFIHILDVRTTFALPNVLGDLVVPGWCVCRIAERTALYFPEDNEVVTQETQRVDEKTAKVLGAIVGEYLMASDIDAATDTIEKEAIEAEATYEG